MWFRISYVVQRVYVRVCVPLCVRSAQCLEGVYVKFKVMTCGDALCVEVSMKESEGRF